MCGIVAAFGQLTAKHEKAFKELLIIDQLRGPDSTGILSVKRHDVNKVVIAKQVGRPEELFNDKRVDACFSGQVNVLIGHNRWKTQGAVNRQNAHPFEFDKVAGVHNGSLLNKWELLNGNQFDVDSEALYHHINEQGFTSAIKKARGAAALVWYNKEFGTVNLWRNHERPLYFVEVGDGSVVFLASEAWMIEGVCERNEIAINTPQQIRTEHLVSVPVAKGTGKLGKVTITPVEQGKIVPFAGTGGYKGGGTGLPVVQNQSFHHKTPECPWSSDEIKETIDRTGKDLVLSVGPLGKSEHGAMFTRLEDVTDPEKLLIVFHHGKVESELKNAEFAQGSISRIQYMKNLGWVWIVDAYTITALEVPPEDDGVLIPDAKGNLITKEQHHQKYPMCSFCTSDIDLSGELTHRYTKEGDILCGDCCKDKEILELTSLV